MPGVKHLSLALFLAAPCGSASAATYYTATTGSDASPGTLSKPFRTIAHGWSVLQPGDILLIRGGVYPESFNTNTFDFPSGTSWSAPVTLAAFPGEAVTLNPVWNVFNFGAAGDQYLIFDGLIIDGARMTDSASRLVSINQGTHHVRFLNCEFKNAYATAIEVEWGNNNGLSSDFNEFVNCHIHRNGRYGGSGNPDLPAGQGQGVGILIRTSNNLVEGCEIDHNGTYGVELYDDGPTRFGNDNVIRNNHIHDTFNYANVLLGNGNRNILANNLIGGGARGVAVDYRAVDNKVVNNAIYGAQRGIELQAIDRTDTKGTWIKNNVFLNNGIAIYTYGTGSIDCSTNISFPGSASINISCANTIATDPMFVDAPNLDFHLKQGSPAIDQAIPLVEVPADFDGVPRPQGSAPDIGAFEYFVPGTLQPGLRCRAGADCASGACVNGVCCNSLCNRGCEVCSAAAGASANGICTRVAKDALCRASAGSPFVCSSASGSPATLAISLFLGLTVPRRKRHGRTSVQPKRAV